MEIAGDVRRCVEVCGWIDEIHITLHMNVKGIWSYVEMRGGPWNRYIETLGDTSYVNYNIKII